MGSAASKIVASILTVPMSSHHLRQHNQRTEYEILLNLMTKFPQSARVDSPANMSCLPCHDCKNKIIDEQNPGS